MRDANKRIVVVVDNCSIHTANMATEWIAEAKGECEIHYQPTNSPEANSVELLWALIKRQVSRQASKSKAQLRASLKAALRSLKESPEKVLALFREADRKYILA